MLEIAVLLLAASAVAVGVMVRLGAPPALGYLAAGLVLGSSGLGVVEHSAALHTLAELGVVFLLFTVGLELSLGTLAAMRRQVFGLGASQVLVTSAVAVGVAVAAGLPWGAAAVTGGAFAMSSTAIVVHQLRDQGELHEPHGRLALAVLLFQDLAVVPFLIAIPVLSGDEGGHVGWELVRTLAVGAAAIAVMLALGRWLWRPALRYVARLRSSELFTLTSLLAALAAAAVTHAVGLSLPLGAFVAGLVLAESELRHRIERDIRPFRDVFLGLFFLMVGLMVDLRASLPVAHWVLLIALGATFGKALLIQGLARLWREPRRASGRAAVALGPGGEFGLTLVVLALTSGLLEPAIAQPLLAAVLISMVTAPFAVRWNRRLGRVLAPRRPESAAPDERGP